MTKDKSTSTPGMFETQRIYQPGKNPASDALYTEFFIENHLDFYVYPDRVATPEQVRFMVYTDGDDRYYPCSDRMFWTIMRKGKPPFLLKRYKEELKKILDLVEHQIEDPYEKAYLKELIEMKFKHDTKDRILIPSRLEKRLLKIYIDHTQIENPYLHEKTQRNMLVSKVLHSRKFLSALDDIDDSARISSATNLEQVKKHVDYLKLRRLFAFSIEDALWKTGTAVKYTAKKFQEKLNQPIVGNGVERLWRFLGVHPDVNPDEAQPKKILWLANEAGEIMIDLAIIRYLARLGHRIIIACKDAPLFTKVDFQDAQTDEHLCKQLEGALLIKQGNLGKNDLADLLKTDHHLMVISDGTRERTNLLLVSTTFARIFKEVDGIISKGEKQRLCFFNTHFQFTQDIYSIARDEKGSASIWYKAKHPAVIKFSHKDLEKMARLIISKMKKTKAKGMTVMFYSGIIGSIPGKVDVAKKIMTTFIRSIKKQSAKTFVINPSEYFETGMDADDLMFMWEIVQRSGFIDIWRFQTNDDIVRAFQVMRKKVPPEWVGKDATFSTGCTKEIKIALEVQRKHPEMQIIGPSEDHFLRRREYGIGKMYERRLDEID
jgi:uncharacterized protein with ATP-grasp and redox domains